MAAIDVEIPEFCVPLLIEFSDYVDAVPLMCLSRVWLQHGRRIFSPEIKEQRSLDRMQSEYLSLPASAKTTISIDFSADGNSIQSDSLSRECLYFDVHTAKPLNAYGMRDTVFASWSCLYGWPTQGMWDEEHQVNAVSRSSDGTVVAYQDTAELLCFSRWPSLSGTCPREYPFVPSAKAVVEFTSDSRSLLHLSEVMTQYKVGSQ